MFFIREVKYLYYYEKSKKRCSAGTCKCQLREDKMVLDIYLRKLPLYYPLKVKMHFTVGTGNQMVEQECEFLQEKQEYQFRFPYVLKRDEGEKLYFFFQLSPERVICDEKTLFEYVTKKDALERGAMIQEVNSPQLLDASREQVASGESNVLRGPIVSGESDVFRGLIVSDESDVFREPVVSDESGAPCEFSLLGKTDGVQKEVFSLKPELYAASGQSVVQIPNIHGQKETYYVVEPKQLKRFGEKFAQYEENSFLLHGYYNYRHILVGPKPELTKDVMRIGVPGNYYKREEGVARMFGFVEFVPTKGEQKTGAFGYYYTTELPLKNR